MTDSEARKFDDATSWRTWRPSLGHPQALSTPGWALPGDPDRYISKDDSAWQAVLSRAQTAYGDPKIHYNTNDPTSERYLVFGDGTRVPSDGTIVYHDAASGKNWIQNHDGSVTLAGRDFKPTGMPFMPAGYRSGPDGNMYMPVDDHGNQIGPQQPSLPAGSQFHGNPKDPNGIWTPINKNGDYYTVDPATGRIDYFDKNGNPISKTNYETGTAPKPPPRQPAPLQSTKVAVPEGMTAPQYPKWATDVDPDIPNQMTGVIVRLYELFGSGKPATSALPEFPFSTDTGEKSGIDAYDHVKGNFKRIESEFDAAAQAFRTAVKNSANVTKAGRDAINNALGTFNSTVSTIPEGNWDALLQAESKLLATVTSEVENAAKSPQEVPANPAGGPTSPAVPPSGMPPGAGAPSPTDQPPPGDTRNLKDLLGGMGSPFGAGMPMGANPLGGLGGMNPLGGLGGTNPLGGGGGNPLAPLSDAVKPRAKLAKADTDKNDEKKSPITPLNPGSPAPLPAATPGGAGAPAPGSAGAAPAATATPAANATSKPTVTLPDGKVVEAPNRQAAAAAQNALDHASPGGDAAQKAYSPTGLELPGDGKNLGAKVDPSDMQPGDVLKWKDKTMVAVAPGLVADSTQPGVTHTLDEVLKDQKGFQGIFRPTATDPTLSLHTSAPPLTDPHTPPHPAGPPSPGNPPAAPPPPDHPRPPPQSPPPASPSAPVPAEPPPSGVPLSGPGPVTPRGPQMPAPQPSATVPQLAPPSPYESAAPPPARRSTRNERIAAGIE
jgi:hypothetical protein